MTETGSDLIRRLAAGLPDAPGVYRMLDAKGETLYVGKARSLKKRVASYTVPARQSIRIGIMIGQTHDMAFVRTHTEAEALLLEANLIKKLKPRYNILLRDDKSFPYLLLTGDHDFPMLVKHRGPRTRKGDYYGPFASGGAVNSTVISLQKAFLLRNCSDNVFAGRTRPCLQYHIKRCTAPCVKYVTKEQYAQQAQQARDFLSGRGSAVQEDLARAMQEASAEQDYETAALLRDRIRALTAVQAKQDVNVEGLGDADVIGLHREGEQSCVQVFFFRAGANFGNRAYFPRHDGEDADEDILSSFIAQFYQGRPVPPLILVSHAMKEKELMQEAFAGTSLHRPDRGTKKRLVDFAVSNAREELGREETRRQGDRKNLEAVTALFGLEETPDRIEIYDNSHASGTNMTGVMVVAGPEGFHRNAYRKFNIREAAPGDDTAMMREVIKRRFSGKGLDGSDRPGLLLIDGGKGQIEAVLEALEDAGASDIPAVAIAKGPDRNAGRETFHMKDRTPFQLPPADPVLHYLQRLRDEAHRFAIGAHRARRARQSVSSPLDSIPGIGPARKKALLMHFGSGKDVARAGLHDLERVEGISKEMAQRIYSHFHEGTSE